MHNSNYKKVKSIIYIYLFIRNIMDICKNKLGLKLKKKY